MHRFSLFVVMLIGLSLTLTMAGCEKAPSKGTEALKDVSYALPFQREVAENVNYTGRINAKDMVVIQARVTGMLLGWKHKEGDIVGKNEILCQIDPDPFKAQYGAAQAATEQSKASKDYAEATYQRFEKLREKSPDSVSDQELAQYKAQWDQGKANFLLAKENEKLAKYNLDWTDVRAPIEGRMSRYFKTSGNIVNQDSTQLTTLVSLNPVYAYFDVDEPTLLRMKQAIDAGDMAPIKEGKNKVMMKLVDEAQYGHDGFLNFLDNQVNPGTGSISVRGEFQNPKVHGESYKFLPGMFVRIQLPLGKAKKQFLIRDQVILTEQQGKFVWIVDQENKARKRAVRLGQLQDDGMRVILQNASSKDSKNWLKTDDKIIINQLLRISEGLPLDNPHKMEMQSKQDSAK